MTSFLDEVIKAKTGELEERKRNFPLADFIGGLEKAGGKFLKAISGCGLKIVAEIKPRSPVLGKLAGRTELKEKLAIYARHAQAISVLTDRKFFDGSVELLAEITAELSLPTLLKDFVIDPYQVYEGRKAGAEAILLIVKILTDKELQSLHELSSELGMSAVLEVQNERELERAEELKPSVLLINNRDLDSLKIDLATTAKLASRVKTQSIVISASGIETGEDLLKLRPHASCFLVGSAFMNAADPEAKFQEFLRAESTFQKTGGTA